jgi:hypothetical protein
MPIDEALSSDEMTAIAAEAYTFSFPMLMGYRFTFGSFLVESLPSYRGPLNTFTGEPKTLDYTFKDVITPNADTPYSAAALDLRAEPLVLSVPAVTDRYYVLQMEDLFGANSHYVGSRATGAAAGTYLLAGPGWEGAAPEGCDAVLPFETDLVFIIGRTQLLGPDDTEALGGVMSGYRLQPLSTFLGTPAPPSPGFEWPIWNDEASRDERFIGIVNALLPLCQPTPADEVELMRRFGRIGLTPNEEFDPDGLAPRHRAALRAGVDLARTAMADKAAHLSAPVNGWASTDAFGDRRRFAGDYLLRAGGAMAGWGGNDRAEADYPLTRVDSQDRPLDGAHAYRLTFPTLPPAKAFWSVTIYDTTYDGTAGYLVENPIDRYLVNSITQGLIFGDDHSLTIHIQREEPNSVDGKANWLPAPAGPFYLVLRIYWPDQPALDGTWTAPPVEKIASPS